MIRDLRARHVVRSEHLAHDRVANAGSFRADDYLARLDGQQAKLLDERSGSPSDEGPKPPSRGARSLCLSR
jgi:hypothetical protein